MHALIIIIMEKKNCRQAKTINTNQLQTASIRINIHTRHDTHTINNDV